VTFWSYVNLHFWVLAIERCWEKTVGEIQGRSKARGMKKDSKWRQILRRGLNSLAPNLEKKDDVADGPDLEMAPIAVLPYRNYV
jgi:hypothetical protein